MICAGTELLVDVLKSKVRQSVWCSTKVYSNFTSFLVKKFLRKFQHLLKAEKAPCQVQIHQPQVVSNVKKTDVILVCKNFLVNSNTFSSAQTGKTYLATNNKQRFSCSSTNVVYLVHCKKCNLQYVGSTTTEFKVSTGSTNHL